MSDAQPPPERRCATRTGRIAAAWIVAVIGPLALVLLKLSAPQLSDQPLVLFLAPVALAAWFGGLWPGVVAMLLGVNGGDITASATDAVALHIENPVALTAFVVEAVIVIGVIEALHRSQARIASDAAQIEAQRVALAEREAELREAHARLQKTSRMEIAAHQLAKEEVEGTLRSTEEQLRQAQKMEAIGRLAGGVAHDFNNLLSVILTQSALIAHELSPRDPMRADLEDIEKAGQRAAGLTRQLLAFSRQQVMEPRRLDLNDVIGDMDKMLRRLIGEDVDLATRGVADLDAIEADPGQIEQVVMNLVVNARDAMPTGGRLTIETANVVLDEEYARTHVGVTPGPHVMLAVSDNGSGMDKETQRRIFEPFFTTKPAGKGTGLGLSTVFGIVQQSGGSVWVYSEVGVGTTFKLYFPRAVDAAPERVVRGPTVGNLRGTETVLLVEDEDQVRAVARTILRRHGYQVLEARNGGEALLLAEQHPTPIELLVSDVVMPQMSGVQLARRLAGIRPTMKVMCMSGYTDEAVIHHGLVDAGIAFMQKPFTPDALARKVREVLDSVA